MSKINDSYTPNKEEKSPKVIIISKDRIQSAKNKINYLTLKEGDIKYTIKLNNDSVNKKGINKAVYTMKQQILNNSRSYAALYDKQKLKKNLKKNILKSPYKENINSRKSHIIKRKDLIIETTRSYNLMKTTENNNDNNNENNDNNYNNEDNEYNNEANINKLETIIPNDTNTEENLKTKNNDNMKNIKQIILNKNNKNNYNNNNIQIDDSIPMKLSEKSDNNNNKNINNYIIDENNLHDTGVVSRNYINSMKNNNNIINKNENNFDKYKSEQIYSNSSINKVYDSVQTNNIDKNYQRSDKAAKSISEQEQDFKTKIVSKLIMITDRISETEDNKTNNKNNINEHRLTTEYVPEDQYIKDDNNDLISESRNSKTIKVDDNDEFDEEDNNKNKIPETINIDNNNINNNIIYNNDYNNIKNIYNREFDNDINSKMENNNKFGIISEEFDKKKLENMENIRKNQSLPTRNTYTLYKMCTICEHVFPMSRLFVAECNSHYLCRKCSKNYYEDIIENGVKEMICPFIKCKEPMDIEDLEKIISREHYNILFNNNKNIKETQNKFCFTKLKTNVDNENIQLYTKKHVIDINSNKNLYNYNNTKGVYCPKCYKNSLFSKTNTYFFKCLNCGCKICKYCFKDYNDRHIDSSYVNHCKVYYRFDEEEKKKLNICYNFSLQLFFVVACYYLCFAGTFLILREKFFNLFDIKSKKYIFLYLLAYLFTIILFIIIIPFIAIFYPYFPSILAIWDY